MNSENYVFVTMAIMPDGSPVPELMTEQELIKYLRIPEISNSSNYSNVVKNLLRFHDLPRIHLCRKLLFPKIAIVEWINNQTDKNKR